MKSSQHLNPPAAAAPGGRSGLSGGKTGPRIAAELTGWAAGHAPGVGSCTCPCPSCSCLATRELVEATGHSGSAAGSSWPGPEARGVTELWVGALCTRAPPPRRQGAGPLPSSQEWGHMESPPAPQPRLSPWGSLSTTLEAVCDGGPGGQPSRSSPAACSPAPPSHLLCLRPPAPPRWFSWSRGPRSRPGVARAGPRVSRL